MTRIGLDRLFAAALEAWDHILLGVMLVLLGWAARQGVLADVTPDDGVAASLTAVAGPLQVLGACAVIWGLGVGVRQTTEA